MAGNATENEKSCEKDQRLADHIADGDRKIWPRAGRDHFHRASAQPAYRQHHESQEPCAQRVERALARRARQQRSDHFVAERLRVVANDFLCRASLALANGEHRHHVPPHQLLLVLADGRRADVRDNIRHQMLIFR